jgi:hypothetical protein
LFIFARTLKREEMNIFEIKNFVVTFSPQALVLAPFKEIWLNDKSKDKSKAVKELSYVYYIADDRSDYMYILDIEERKESIIRDLEIDPNWIIPTYIEEAIEYYEEASQTTSTQMLKSTRGVIEKISKFLDDIDVNERDKNNKPVFDIGKIVASVEKVPKLVKALNEIEQEIVKEKELKANTGSKNGGVFDDMGI